MKKTDTSAHKQIRVFDGIPMLIVAVVLVVVLAIIGFVGSNNIRRILIQMFIYCTLGVMWNLMSGYTGMTSLGQQSFIGVAG